jgi:hypothetical protein
VILEDQGRSARIDIAEDAGFLRALFLRSSMTAASRILRYATGRELRQTRAGI